MKRVLVTGGAGFLGSHLCETLLNKETEVICVDNFFSGSKDNIRHLLSHPNFELIRHDVILPLFLEVSQVYHLACPASPIHYQYNSIKTVKTNVIGTINMLGLAKRTGSRFLLASTSEIYGDPEIHPQPESYWGHVNPIGLRSCYDEGKRVAETLTMDYFRQNRVDIKIVRIFNTYGPRMAINDGRVISNLVVQALRHEPMTIYGDGRQTRSFCYVSDLISGLLSIMETEGTTGPFNLGNPEEYTILELANIILKLTKSPSKIVHRELPADDPVRRCPDISSVQDKTGWSPKIGLEEGLKKTIASFQDKIEQRKGT